MARRRLHRRNEKKHRHTPPPTDPPLRRTLIREAERVERLAYTRSQAAEALGISQSTFNRRLLPLIHIVQMPSGTRLIPVDELERLMAEQRYSARAQSVRPAPVGRKPGLPPAVIERIRQQHAADTSLAEIARTLNSDNVPTAQGGRQWWPSTVRAVLNRPSPPDTARANPET